MLDFFTIFGKGGIVLWCFQGAGVTESFTGPVNALIRSVILQVGFQKILTLTYVDKLITDVQLQFRDRYKNELDKNVSLKLLNSNFEFENDFNMLLREAEDSSKAKGPASMRTFTESLKSQKTVKSMIETKGGDKVKEQGGKKNKNAKKEGKLHIGQPVVFSLLTGHSTSFSATKSPKPQKPKEKQRRVWDMGGSSPTALDYSDPNSPDVPVEPARDVCINTIFVLLHSKTGCLLHHCWYSTGGLSTLHSPKKGVGFGGMFGMLKGLVGAKSLSREDMEPVLDKMRDHLIAKNVAAEISIQLCDSVAKKLEGKVMGTFTTVASTVKQALQESLVQILQPKRRVDILRDVLEARSQRRPFIVTFCGVNGVGKSTNLAKISFWLIENGFTVLIAACDTFRAGAVEQLRTHQRRLNSLHPPEQHGGRPVVQLYEKGYGKDAAGIAMEAIAYARNQAFDVVLVDTAGRMQDNAPLMTALAKLIAVNMPDLVLFVGEALVGNEAVDQLVKFNQALADHSMSDKPRLIDGIVLTKFDTIDDKVGAAISMTYITGQPIVFVGTGQTYNDLRSLNARAVVSALMKA
uniref:SRP receptor subunit alpha n=1 Tax=Gadus morhua TaxID=8049 RepID=A0A8C5AIK3_GADMO